MKVGELKKVLKDLPNHFEVAMFSDTTYGVNNISYAQRKSDGSIQAMSDGARVKTSNMLVLKVEKENE